MTAESYVQMSVLGSNTSEQCYTSRKRVSKIALNGQADTSCPVSFTTRRKFSLFFFTWAWTSLILVQWTGQVLRGEPKVQRRWEGSVIWDTVELDGLGIPDLFTLVCFGRVFLLGKMCLPSLFHLDSDWSYLVLRKKTTITAETGSCELIFSFTCIDYNVKDSKSIHLNVSLEKKKKVCQCSGILPN